jgi:hypothetical protein
MYISISFTSSTVQQEKCDGKKSYILYIYFFNSLFSDKSEEFLSKINCLTALYSIHSTRWFQVRIFFLFLVYK